ncbi:MAG: hypothetical protein IJH50_01105 [Kiritimatiellae bacterium]|nr:hypothetical protein [Kiritimatiellia bacterium]
MKKRMVIGVVAFFTVALNVMARTVAYWPLAYENGVRTTTATLFANQGDGGTLDAVPSSRQGASWISGNTYCPQGTNAFPVGYGVYDPVSGTNAVAATGLYFHKISLNGYAGALRVADPAALRLTTFTVECFIRMQQGTAQGDWNCIAVMPAQLPDSNTGLPANYESWGLRVVGSTGARVRFSKNKGTVSANLAASDNQQLDIAAPNIYDGRWHHIAFSVNEKKVKVFWDYAFLTETTLSENVWYNPGMDLFIGNTPQTSGPFGGSIAHFRISDEALDPPSFLHFTRTERAADEDPDVLLHLDFEPPEGISETRTFFNDAAIGPAVHNWGAETVPRNAAVSTPFSPVYAGLLDETGRTSAYCMTNSTKYINNGTVIVKRYVAWQPPEDVFSNSSFTVECCYKTAGQLGNYIPLVRRLGGYNCQFNLGFNGGSNVGKLAALTVPGATGSTVQIIDTIRTDDGKWHHAAVVFDRARSTMTLFRDYEPVSSLNYTGIVAPTNTPIYIGGGYANDGNFNPYDGAIDNVRITMRALTVGEFLRSDHVAPSGKTIAWASFDNTLDATAPAYALTNGNASAAATGGAVPSYMAFPGGDDIRIEDGSKNVLRVGNLAALLCATSVVKYADNLLLPLVKDQTIEFRIKADPQEKFAGVVRCNLYRDTAPIPVWGLSGGELDSRVLRFRCALAGASYFEEAGMNEDTGVIAFDGKWHHIALTLSQANGKVTASIYKDYEATPSWTKTKAGRLCYGAGYASVWVGASSSTTAFFNGQIDELRISRAILTPAEFLRLGKRGLTICIK